MFNKIKAFKYFIVVVIFSTVIWLYYFTNQQVLLEGTAFTVTEDDFSNARKKFDKNYTDQQLFANLVEEKLRSQLLEDFKIESGDDAKISYFNKHHPQTVSKEVFDKIINSSSNLLSALEDIRDDKLDIDEAYDKYLFNQMLKEDWKDILKSVDETEMIKSLKSELSRTYSSFTEQALALLNDEYFKETISESVCELEEVKKKLDLYVEKVNKKLFRSVDKTDPLVKNLLKAKCAEESKAWLKLYFEKNYKLSDKKYSGYEQYLSFY